MRYLLQIVRGLLCKHVWLYNEDHRGIVTGRTCVKCDRYEMGYKTDLYSPVIHFMKDNGPETENPMPKEGV